MDVEVWNAILGSGGGIALISALISWQKDRSKTKGMREDTALSRLNDDYERCIRGAEKAWTLVNWYRATYAILWAAYMRWPPEDKEFYPPAPPSDIDH